MSRAQTPDRIESDKIDGDKVKISYYHADPEYAACIEVERDDRWVFGVDGDGVATLLTTSAVGDDLLAEPDVPEWLSDSLFGLGIEEVEA